MVDQLQPDPDIKNNQLKIWVDPCFFFENLDPYPVSFLTAGFGSRPIYFLEGRIRNLYNFMGQILVVCMMQLFYIKEVTADIVISKAHRKYHTVNHTFEKAAC